jgi:hypothetical protein
MRSDQILGLFQLEWQHRLVYHVAHLVGSVCVVSEQYLSIRINGVLQPSSLKNARQSRLLGRFTRLNPKKPAILIAQFSNNYQ